MAWLLFLAVENQHLGIKFWEKVAGLGEMYSMPASLRSSLKGKL